MSGDAWWWKVVSAVARDTNASLPHSLAMLNVEQKRRQISNRSTAVPMDFEFTHRVSSNAKPVWAADDPFHAPQKRTTRLSPLKFT